VKRLVQAFRSWCGVYRQHDVLISVILFFIIWKLDCKRVSSYCHKIRCNLLDHSLQNWNCDKVTEVCMTSAEMTTRSTESTLNSTDYLEVRQVQQGCPTRYPKYEAGKGEFVGWVLPGLLLHLEKLSVCKIWGFHGSDYEEWCLLGCYALLLLWEPTFRRNLAPLTSGWQESLN
jgi:hypothetical protein